MRGHANNEVRLTRIYHRISQYRRVLCSVNILVKKKKSKFTFIPSIKPENFEYFLKNLLVIMKLLRLSESEIVISEFNEMENIMEVRRVRKIIFGLTER